MENTLHRPGYHLQDIPKGQLGEISKIEEELLELKDAHEQRSKIMELVELSDMLGAVALYLEKHHAGTSINDLQIFSAITRRAFENGHRE